MTREGEKPESGPVLELVGIEKAFGAVSVLRGVSLNVGRGEVHALLGENGAGKSTLMRILLGAESADRGEMKVASERYAPASPGAARRSGVVMVPQERTLCPHLTVLENVVLGLESGGLVRRSDERVTAERALSLVTGVGRRIGLDVRAGQLSVADQQLVEIARALAQGGAARASDERGGEPARILVLDEPTSSLGHDDAARLFTRVHALKAAGLAVILVTHFLGDVRAHADRYTVLRDGKVQGEGDPKTTPPEQIVREMLGRELEAAREEQSGDRAAASVKPSEGDILLEVEGLGGKVRPRTASFVLRRGEVLGIAGLVGSGRTELLRLVAGLDVPVRGSVNLRAQKGIGLLSEDHGGEGLMLRRSIAENVTLSKRGSFLSMPGTLLAEGARWIGELSVKA
ncbi:MAG: hypothetical protein K0S65_4992, partial [Labilithrix sp.]|nr:hypothetical protein [Labilithrix sp.]